MLSPRSVYYVLLFEHFFFELYVSWSPYMVLEKCLPHELVFGIDFHLLVHDPMSNHWCEVYVCVYPCVKKTHIDGEGAGSLLYGLGNPDLLS